MRINLKGPEGNTWALIGYVRRWGKQLEWPDQKIKAIGEDMRSGDYNHALDVFENAFKDMGVEFDGDPRKGGNDDDDE